MNSDKKLSQNSSSNDHKRTVSFLIISLLLHAFLLVGFYTYEVFFKSDSIATKVEIPPDVQFIDISDANNGRLVEQSEDEKATEKPKDARFVSKVDKSVEKETRAARHGEYQNQKSKESQAANSQQFAPPPPASEPTPEAASASDETLKTYDSGDLQVPQAPKKKISKAKTFADLRPNTMQEMSQNSMGAVSQTSDYLKDVAIGAETHLNTREFLYYSYFNRIKKKLRQHWEPLVHAKVRLMYKKGRDVASTGSKATRVVITLDEQGLLRRVQVSTTSGLEDLDDAAIEALKEAAQFPNPPKDLVREGYVTLNWDFILES
jgi:TonB family protein